LSVTDEVVGTGAHSLDLRFILAPGWEASSEMMRGEVVSCVLIGPRRMTMTCEAESRLTLSILPTEISREYGVGLAVSSITIQTTASLPAKMQTRVQWD
jgi:Heparinase II/III-like protein